MFSFLVLVFNAPKEVGPRIPGLSLMILAQEQKLLNTGH